MTATHSLDSKPAKGVFFRAGRLNHSCVPNCHAAWDPDLQMLCVHAIREIQRGEELYIHYDAFDLFFARQGKRIAQQREKYGFDCSCPACSAPPHVEGGVAQEREKISRVHGEDRRRDLAERFREQRTGARDS